MKNDITLSGGASISVMGNETNRVVANPESLGDTFVDRCIETNYVSLEDYSKFGTLKLGKAVHWKQGDFYKAVQSLADEDARLCKVHRRRIPCVAVEKNSDYKDGEQTKYYIKGASGFWGFRYDMLRDFMQNNGDEIAEFVDKLEAKRADEAEIKAMKKALAKERKCTISELEGIILRELMEAKNV